ncbi:MAG: hypothetical protein HPY57_14440 [Ignavibacteria bacterium]|nr:hypothetical protein [Ignavibacteria bacterium]
MSKKKHIEDDNEEILDNTEENSEKSLFEEEGEDSIDLNIDIDEENYNKEELCILEEEDTEFDKIFKGTVNKHKLEGIHTLKRDTIFMGKEEQQTEEIETLSMYIDLQNESYEIEKGSDYELESRHYEDYYYRKELVKDVYEILKENTDIDFVMNRRKPNKQTFNDYYVMCVTKLNTKYSKSEIFVELSYYFTDNIFNMFKLLNKKNATGIILELKEKGYLTDIGNINFI